MSGLGEIKARLSAAVPGPWSLSLDYQRKWMLLLAESGTADEYRIAKLADDDTAEFIAHSPTDVAKLIAALEAVESGLAGLDEIFNGGSEDDEVIRAISDGLRASMAEALS